MKSTNEYLTLLRQYMDSHAGKYGVARGQQTENSDVDICFEAPAPNLLTLARIKFDLEALLGSRVDLVRLRDRMDEYLKRNIEKEALYV